MLVRRGLLEYADEQENIYPLPDTQGLAPVQHVRSIEQALTEFESHQSEAVNTADRHTAATGGECFMLSPSMNNLHLAKTTSCSARCAP